MVPNQAKHRKYVWEHTTINYFSHFSINVSVWRYRPLNWKTSDIISSLWICNIANKTKTWTYFSPVLFFIFKPVLSFPVQIQMTGFYTKFNIGLKWVNLFEVHVPFYANASRYSQPHGYNWNKVENQLGIG